MKIDIGNRRDEGTLAGKILLVPFFEDEKQINESYVDLFKNLQGIGFKGKKNEIRVTSIGNSWETICAIGLGKREKYNIDVLRTSLSSGFREIQRSSFTQVDIEMPGVDDMEKEAMEIAYIAEITLYEFSKYKSGNEKKNLVEKIKVLGEKSIEKSVENGQILGKATNYARDFANMPSSDGTPSFYESMARSLKNVKVSVIEKEKFKELGMGGLEGVSRAAKEPAKLVIMEYNNSTDRPFAMIGKGITFDSGGISIKPSSGMQDMKFDKCGASAVLGAMKALSEMEAKVNVIGLAPLTENLPGGNAYKPGDILTHYNGKTSEVITTDAEGRLVMADALSYAVDKFKPKAILDISTLTGACVTALGNNIAGLMGN
ncbi:leucyl aminopeptidase, partial [mine drainage metagenome]